MLNPELVRQFFRWLFSIPEEPQLRYIPVDKDPSPSRQRRR